VGPSPADPPWGYLENLAPQPPVLSASEKPPGCPEMLGGQSRRYVWSAIVNAAFSPFGHVNP